MQRTTSTPPHAESLLGRYRILETNTQGGFGSVYVCWDARLQRRVAIKSIPLRLDPDSDYQVSTTEEALAEARTSSLLAHPNIVTVFDFESDGYASYLVMEYVDGLNLADLLARVEDGVLSFDECAHLVNSVASALAYAHENGVLHLDIKPANIMIDRSGTVKLGDFGMATLASAAGYGGARGGTVGYMPPEQVEGQMVDERSDIFSLAVVVWQALTGQCPYAASTPEESLDLIFRGPSPALSRVEPDLAGVVESTLLRALDPSPTARMATVEEFAHDLVDALGDAQEGMESLADLLNQTEEDEQPSTVEDWSRLRVPLSERAPWLGGALVRVLSACVAGYLAYLAIPHIFPASTHALTFGVAGVTIASAAWPPLGSLLGMIAFLAAILCQPATAALPIALVVGLVGISWWIAVGRTSFLASTAALLPACTSSPLAGVGLSGLFLTPGAAFFTGALSYLLCVMTSIAVKAGFFAALMVEPLRTTFTSPQAWILSFGCGLAALLCSILTDRRTTPFVVIGQLLAIGILILSYLACAYVEKASISTTLDGRAIGVAVFLGATLCIASALTGGGIIIRKGDDRA